MTSSLMNASIPWTLIAITVAAAILTFPRHPWVAARRECRAEKRILGELRARALTQPPPPRHYPRVYGIDSCFLTEADATQFDRMAEELEYEWIARALRAPTEAEE
jgi:hypothetical protein